MESPSGEKATPLRSRLVFLPPVLPPLRKAKVETLPLLDIVGLECQIRPYLPLITMGCASVVVVVVVDSTMVAGSRETKGPLQLPSPRRNLEGKGGNLIRNSNQLNISGNLLGSD